MVEPYAVDAAEPGKIRQIQDSSAVYAQPLPVLQGQAADEDGPGLQVDMGVGGQMPDAFPDIIDAWLHVERPALGHGLQLFVDAVPQKARPLHGAGHHQHIVPGLVRLLLQGPGEEVQVVEAVFVDLHRQVRRSVQREDDTPVLRLCPDAQGKGADVHPVHGVEFRESDLHLHAALKVEAGHGRAAHVMHVHLYPVGLQLLPVLGTHRPDPQAVVLLQHSAPGDGVHPQLISFLCHIVAFLFLFIVFYQLINCLSFFMEPLHIRF